MIFMALSFLRLIHGLFITCGGDVSQTICQLPPIIFLKMYSIEYISEMMPLPLTFVIDKLGFSLFTKLQVFIFYLFPYCDALFFILLLVFLFAYYQHEQVDLFGKNGNSLIDTKQIMIVSISLWRYVSTHTILLIPQYNLVMSVLISLGW